MTTEQSFEKFNYLLRPSKQVERKIIIEVLQRLTSFGYEVSKYRYVGMGSVYFADFILFHKYLHIEKMLCVEHGEIPNRMKFNKPFPFINIDMRPISQVISSLKANKPLFVWLDYDCQLSPDILLDLQNLMSVLAPASIFLITVDAEIRPELDDDVDTSALSAADRSKIYYDQFRLNFEKFVPEGISADMVTRDELPTTLARILNARVKDALLPANLEFEQLFNFAYADNAQMVTFGGLINSSQKLRSQRAHISKIKWVTSDLRPLSISVPHLTMREKLFMDRMRTDHKQLPFELSASQIANYQSFYKYYPSYFEAIT